MRKRNTENFFETYEQFFICFWQIHLSKNHFENTPLKSTLLNGFDYIFLEKIPHISLLQCEQSWMKLWKILWVTFALISVGKKLKPANNPNKQEVNTSQPTGDRGVGARDASTSKMLWHFYKEGFWTLGIRIHFNSMFFDIAALEFWLISLYKINIRLDTVELENVHPRSDMVNMGMLVQGSNWFCISHI